MEVTLSELELLRAAMVGVVRHIKSIVHNRQDRHGFDGSNGEGWHVHIEGACGELAFAKAKNCYWSGTVNTFRGKADVGDIEVKTRSRHDYELLIRPDDNDDSPFVLITGIAPTYRVVGWFMARDAKTHEEWLKTHGGRPPAYFVPQDQLLPIEELAL